MITIKQIRYALAVEDELHFKRAAERCNISQSALSTAIAELETQLGFAVFERDNKKVLITALGERFLSKAREVYVAFSDLNGLSSAVKAPLSGPMSIGIIPTIAPYLLPLMLPAVSEQYPLLDLQIEEEQSQRLVEKVSRGDLDAGILALPYDCQGLLSFPFWDEDFLLAVPRGHELESAGEIGPEQLKLSRLLLLKDGHCLKDHALAACKIAKGQGFSMGGTSLSTLIQLVAGGMGVTLIPEMAKSQLIEQQSGLRSIPLKEPGPHRQIAFVIRPNYPALDNIERLKQLLSTELAQAIGH